VSKNKIKYYNRFARLLGLLEVKRFSATLAALATVPVNLSDQVNVWHFHLTFLMTSSEAMTGKSTFEQPEKWKHQFFATTSGINPFTHLYPPHTCWWGGESPAPASRERLRGPFR